MFLHTFIYPFLLIPDDDLGPSPKELILRFTVLLSLWQKTLLLPLAYFMLKTSTLRHWICVSLPAHKSACSHGSLLFTRNIHHIPALISAFINIPSNNLELLDMFLFQLSGLLSLKHTLVVPPHIFQIFDSNSILGLT